MKHLLLLVLFTSCASHAADIKKWTDENGLIHYGDNPPAKVPSESIRVSRPPSDPGKPLPRLDTKTEQEPGASDTTETPVEDSFPQTSEEQAASVCAQAKKDLAVLRRSNRIRLKSGDGKVHYMSAEEIEARKKQSQEDIDQFCKDE